MERKRKGKGNWKEMERKWNGEELERKELEGNGKETERTKKGHVKETERKWKGHGQGWTRAL